MTTFSTSGDNRIKFTQSVSLAGTCSVTLDITGGPLANFQVAIFDAQDNLLNGEGTDKYGPPLDTAQGGHASWPFPVPQTSSYIKWGVQAYRSAANLGSYTAEVNVLDSTGHAVATGSFNATIPNGVFQDDIVYDGVMLLAQASAVPAGPSVVPPAGAGG